MYQINLLFIRIIIILSLYIDGPRYSPAKCNYFTNKEGDNAARIRAQGAVIASD
jgi:hypothetical protein